MAEYRLTPAAERDLESIWIHTRQEWGGEQANRYIDRLVAVLADLAQAPRTAPATQDSTRLRSHPVWLSSPKR